MGRKKLGAIAKLLQDIKPYYSKRELDKTLSCAAATRRKWEGFCLETIPDFAEHWEAKQPLNFHQAMCLAMIAEWKLQYYRIADSQLIDLIESNAETMTIETVMRTSKEAMTVKSKACSSSLVKVA